MALAGHLSKVQISGTPVTVTGEATTSLGSDRFQITDTARRVVDITAAITVYDGVTPLASSGWSLDGLFGIFSLTSTPAGAVTVDMDYHPLLEIATARAYELNTTRENNDATPFKTKPERRRKAQLATADGSISRLDFGQEDYDPGGAVERFLDYIANGTPKLLDLSPGGSSVVFRAWVLFESDSLPVSVESVQEGSISWQSAARDAAAGTTATANFGWSDLA